MKTPPSAEVDDFDLRAPVELFIVNVIRKK